MTLTEAADLVKTNGMQLIRARRAQAEGEAIQYDVKDYEGSKRGWTLLDATTASAIRAVYAALNDANRAKLNRLPLSRAINVIWKLVA